VFRTLKMGRYSGALKLIGDVLRETKEELLTTVFVITHPPPSRTSVRGGIGGSLYVFCVFVFVAGAALQLSIPMRARSAVLIGSMTGSATLARQAPSSDGRS